jgi:hypothetical protein
MPQYYRISPVLWDSVPGQYTATVYSIDRIPEGPLRNYVTCNARCKDDPAYWWAGSSFLRLVMPPDLRDCCAGPQNIANGVVYAQLPSWISWATSQGYSLPDNFQFNKIRPTDDITLIYQ